MLGPWFSATIELAFLRFVAAVDIEIVETLIVCRPPGLVTCASLPLIWWMSKVLERARMELGCLLGEDFADCLDECLIEDVDEVAEEEAIDELDSWDLESHWLTDMVIELTDGERFI